MNDINKLEKEKLLQLLECNIEELDILIRKSSEIPQESDNSYDILLKITLFNNFVSFNIIYIYEKMYSISIK